MKLLSEEMKLDFLNYIVMCYFTFCILLLLTIKKHNVTV